MQKFSGVTVRVSDLLVSRDGASWLEDLEIDNCVIVGPAVLLLPSDEFAFASCTLDTVMFWPLDDMGRAYSGAVGVRRCRFHRCSFREVGIAAPRAVIDQFFA